MTDIVERLHKMAKQARLAASTAPDSIQDGLIGNAETFETAAAEIERLREALKEIKLRTESYRGAHDEWPMVASIHDIARAALKATPPSA